MNPLIILISLIWGYHWVVMKMALNYFPPITFSALRFIIGVLILLGICFWKRVGLPRKDQWKWIITSGLTQTFYVHVIVQISVNYIDAGLSSVLYYTMPFWLTILAHFLIPGDRLNLAKIVGLTSGISGLFLIMNISFHPDQWGGTSLGIQLLVISASITWAISNIIFKTKVKPDGYLSFTAYQMAIGTIGLLLLALVTESPADIVWNSASITYLLFSGMIATALSFYLWFYVLSKENASKTSIALLLTPVFGVLSGILFLGETLQVKTIFGIILIILGIRVVNSASSIKLWSSWRSKKECEKIEHSVQKTNE